MKKWNILHSFKTEADILNYLEAVWEEKDVEFLQFVVSDAVAGWRKLQKNGTAKDKYAKQRKWIGKLCKFWNEDKSFWTIGILERIIPQGIDGIAFVYNSPDNYNYFYTGTSYQNCEPITSDDKLIYKGE